MTPELSIIIPAYNSEAYIGQALDSVFHQTYGNFEILLIDDASSDSTVKIARSYLDSRLKIISHKRNRGVSYSRNCGIKAAKGNWIALLDSDDWYAPPRLEKLLEVAKAENADLVADDLHLIRDCEASRRHCEFQPWGSLLRENKQQTFSTRLISAVDFVKSDRPNPINAKRNWSFGYTKPLIRREFLLKHNIQYDETIRVGEDYILYLECLRQQGRFIITPKAYYYYRTREISLSTRKPTAYLADSCQITKIFINREIEERGDSLLLKALFENLISYQKRLAYYRVLGAIKQKQLLKTIQQILYNPYTLGYLFIKFISIVQQKSSLALEGKKIEPSKSKMFSAKNKPEYL